jgi:hypothetical protein
MLTMGVWLLCASCFVVCADGQYRILAWKAPVGGKKKGKKGKKGAKKKK